MKTQYNPFGSCLQDDAPLNATILQTLVKQEYEWVTMVDTLRNRITQYSSSSPAIEQNFEDSPYEQTAIKTIQSSVYSKDIERVCEAFKLKTILQRLLVQPAYQISYSVVHNDGSLLKKQAKFWSIDDKNRFIIIARSDITDLLKEHEECNKKLSAALMQAQNASLAKSLFLSRVSHEIRTPMSAIISMAQLAQAETENPDKTVDCLKKIDSAANYLITLINEILDMSYIESERITLKPASFSFSHLLCELNTIIGTQAQACGIFYLCKSEGFCESSCYLGDAVRLKQVLINLLGNAIKFTPAGGSVELSAKKLSTASGGDLLEFTISDTGIGIDPAFLPQLFSPFSQECREPASREGAGLGLAITRSLIELMHGTIDVESHVGDGSVFTVRLSLPCAVPVARCHATAAAFRFTGRRILVAEDRSLNITVLQKLLTCVGFEVDVAKNGRLCFDLFAGSKPGWYSAVLMDVCMPVMDGLEAAAQIRRLSRHDALSVPIIAMTANFGSENESKGLLCGMTAYLTKPIDPTLLYATLQQYIGG